MPRLLIQVLYRPDSRVFIGLLDQLCRLRLPSGREETQIRRVEEVDLDLSLLAHALQRYADCLAAVRYKHDPRLNLIVHGQPVTVPDIVPDTVPVEEIRFYGH